MKRINVDNRLPYVAPDDPTYLQRHVTALYDVLRDLAAELNDHFNDKWDDLRFAAGAIALNPIGAVSAPAVDNVEADFPGTLLFSGSADNIVADTAQLPHTWRRATPLVPHIHWSNPTGTANAVTWEFYYRDCGHAGITAEAWVGPLTGTLVAGDPSVSNQHCITTFGEITLPATRHESTCINWRLYRRGSTDASSGTARLLSVDWHIQNNSAGTATEIPQD